MIYAVIGIYLAVVSLVAFILPIVDKSRAQKGKWRVPEATLFLFSFLGGAVTMYVSMQIFRHKTKHKRFMIGIPLIILLHIAIVAALFYFKIPPF